jgi:Alginate lyase
VFKVSRREFLILSAAAVTTNAAGAGVVDEAHEMFLHPRRTLDVLEKPRVLRAAQRYLAEYPKTIVSFPAPRSAGGPHDYYSEADYFWPDPENPAGPYVNRDGESNPANFNDHRLLLIRLGIQVPALAAAWMLTRRREFAQHAVDHLRAWFVAAQTRINPSLKYAQAVRGSSTGRNWGIIDTLHLAEVAQAAIVLHDGNALSEPDWNGVRKWFEEYLDWLQTSEPGRKERDAKNNHGTCWIVQAAAFARLVSDETVLRDCRERLTSVVFPTQIASDGSLPLELERTKPYGYSLFDLDALGMAAHILSNEAKDLWSYKLADGRSLGACFQFMAAFIANKNAWPYKPDIQYFDDLPVRQPSLLFAGLAYRNREYVALWRRLNPDPTVPEVIRNHPYRQPLLWI